MNKQFKSFIIEVTIATSIIFILFLVGFGVALGQSNITPGEIFSGSAIVLMALLITSFVMNASNNLAGNKSYRLALIITFVLYLVGMLLTIIYAICMMAGASVDYKAFTASVMCIGAIFSVPLLIVALMYLFKTR
ncbi:hypothetical protein [Mycoplasmopsis adleri]|uniref:hypothetical protein n=1 Tax=Mycoplasmopsis adleri TaxID=51362 RepID=UPI003872E02A